MIKKFLSLFLAFVLTAALFTSCGDEPEYPVKIGNITVDKEPQSIVILDKNLADIISAIGYDVKMTGRSDEVTQKGLKVVPEVGTSHDPSVTTIKEQKTDIVFANDTLNKTDIEKLEKAGITVARFENANTIKQLSSLYEKIGRMLGGNIQGKTKAKKAFREIKDTLKAVKTAAKRDKTITTLAYLYIDNGVLKTVNGGSWCSNLLSYTGSVNVFENAESDVVDIDKLTLANPDHLFVADKDVEQYLANSDVLGGLDALNGKTFIIPYDDLQLQGFTSLDVIEQMMNDITGKSNAVNNNEQYEDNAE